MHVLVTGGAGFIGSNFIRYMLQQHEQVHIVNLDLLTYAGNSENLQEFTNDPRYTFVKGNIGDSQLVDNLIQQHNIDIIVNFAAESHVDRSIRDPRVFVET